MTEVIYLFKQFEYFFLRNSPFLLLTFWIEMVGVSLICEERVDEKAFHNEALHPKYHYSHFWNGIHPIGALWLWYNKIQQNAALFGYVCHEPYSLHLWGAIPGRNLYCCTPLQNMCYGFVL